MEERAAIRKMLRNNPAAARELAKLMEAGKLGVSSPGDEPEALLCKRWPGLVDGCIQALCDSCGAVVAVAPSSQEIIRNMKGKIAYYFMECMQEGKLDHLKG